MLKMSRNHRPTHYFYHFDDNWLRFVQQEQQTLCPLGVCSVSSSYHLMYLINTVQVGWMFRGFGRSYLLGTEQRMKYARIRLDGTYYLDLKSDKWSIIMVSW